MKTGPALAVGAALLLSLPALAALLGSTAVASSPAPLAAVAPSSSVPLADPFDYSDTILLGNNNSQTSRNLTFYFQAQRGVPDENVLFADLPVGETITEAQWNSFAAWFVNETANRSLGSQINYIVTFKGMPIRVSWSHPGNNGPTSFQDALMLIGGPYEGFIGTANLYGNPYFNRTDRFSASSYGIRLVTGVYAYNESTAKDLIDRASSSLGNRGEYVLDTDSTRGYANSSGAAAWGSYQYANSALVWADGILRARGEATYLDYNSTYVVDRTDVMGYASWGSNDCCDSLVTVHSVPRNQWVNGSIAETFVSTGGRTFSWPPSYGQSLIADWVDEGVSGIKGYTDEPYISATADGHILFDRYSRGYNLAESFWAASHIIGWRQIVIGDPKMAPYSDVGDLSLNTTLTATPAAIDQNGTFGVSVAVTNTATVARDVDLLLGLPGGGVAYHTLAVERSSVSVFDLAVDASSIPSTLWGPQTFTVDVDPNNTVREWDEGNNSWSFDVEIRRAPLASIALDDASLLTFNATALRLGAQRADRPIATFWWRADGGSWNSVPATSDAAVVGLSYNRSGTHTFESYAVDAAGLESPIAGPVALTVLNRAPTAGALANDTSPLSLVPVFLSASSSTDLDGSVSSYRWEGGGLGTWATETVEVVFDRPGLYTFTLTVTDDEGASDSASVMVDVRNRPPRAVAVPDAVEALTAVEFTLDVSGSFDPDGDVVSYTVEFDGQAAETGTSTTWSHAFGSPGATGAWVTVTDDWGATDRVRVPLLVLDRPPEVSWSLAGGTNISEGFGIEVAVTIRDPDSNLFSYSVNYGEGGDVGFVLSGRQAEFTLTHNYAFEGVYQVTLTVADVEGNLTNLTGVVVVEHPAPTVSAFEFHHTNGTLHVGFVVSSPYPDLLTMIVYIDGVMWRSFAASGEGAQDLSLEGVPPGNHTVRFEASDGVKSTVAASGTLTVEEPAPPEPGGGDGHPPDPTAGGVDLVLLGAAAAAAVAAVAVLVILRRRRPPPEGTTKRGAS